MAKADPFIVVLENSVGLAAHSRSHSRGLTLSLREAERRSNLHNTKSRLPRFARNDNLHAFTLE